MIFNKWGREGQRLKLEMGREGFRGIIRR